MKTQRIALTTTLLAALAATFVAAPAAAIGRRQCCATVLGACASKCAENSCTGEGDCSLVIRSTRATSTTPGVDKALATLGGPDRARLRRMLAANDRSQRTLKTAAPRKATVNAGRVSPATRQGFDRFWKGLPRGKASQLQAKLAGLESSAERGMNVQPQLNALRAQYPQLFELSTALSRQRPWQLTAADGAQALTCVGLGWIGRNGRIRCIGKLTI